MAVGATVAVGPAAVGTSVGLGGTVGGTEVAVGGTGDGAVVGTAVGTAVGAAVGATVACGAHAVRSMVNSSTTEASTCMDLNVVFIILLLFDDLSVFCSCLGSNKKHSSIFQRGRPEGPTSCVEQESKTKAQKTLMINRERSHQ